MDAQIIAVLSGIMGLIIMVLCMLKYFRSVSGINAFSRQKKTGPELQTGGLHRYVRHPLYFGTLLFIWSLFLFFPLWCNLMACVVITVYTVFGIHLEERKLIIEFGEIYKIYARQVPMLIPHFFIRRTKARIHFRKAFNEKNFD